MAASNQAQPIYKENDFYVPHFKIQINRKELEKKISNDILSVSYKDNLTDVDSFELEVNNWDAEKRTFKYIEGKQKETFSPGRI